MKIFLILIILLGEIFFINSQSTNLFQSVWFTRNARNNPEICAKAGCVRGKVESGRVKPYEAFYGIPYAEPPVGKLRFENPIPYAGWKGFWDATYPRDACMQRNIFIYTAPILGSEDCLFLNVYRPMNFKKNKKLQVFVWIHGGALLSFSSSPDQFGPEYLMDNGEVILVTLNYRLGLFGFLCSGDAAVKGNFGLKDQQLALKWIATNIEYFGGDQKSITLAGQSSGAASINLHMMNLVSQNLFHRVILQSGTAISPFTYQIDFEAQFRQAAEGSGLENWQTASTFELAYQLKQVNALTLVLAIDQLFAYIATPPVPLRPCIEGDWEGAFLREDPRKVWAEGRFVQKPILIGTNSNEGALGAILTTNATYLRGFNDNIYEFLPSQFDFHPRYAAEVMKFYFGEKDYIDDTNAKDYYRMYTDRLFTYPLITLVQQYLNYADTQENPIFLYEFSFKSSYTLLRTLTGLDINLGVAHNDELFYLFTMKEFIPEFDTTSPEGRMVDIFVRTMVNFAARGEIKDWRRFKPCTPATSTPSCDRQLFLRFKKEDPNQVMVSVTNEIDTEMIKLWSRIDNGINAIELNCN